MAAGRARLRPGPPLFRPLRGAAARLCLARHHHLHHRTQPGPRHPTVRPGGVPGSGQAAGLRRSGRHSHRPGPGRDLLRRTHMSAATPPVLEARGLRAGYGERPVLDGLDMRLDANEVLCLIGHNGAGKSTLLKALFGLIVPEGGSVLLDGQPVSRPDPRRLAAAGISMVPEGRGIFPGLTVAETMRLGLWSAGVPKADHAERLEWVMQVLPALRNFYGQRAGTLSGGQQQMVSLARALLS